MQEEKSAVYTVILGVCLFLCLLMLGNMLIGRADTSTAPAAPEEGNAMEFHITEDDIASGWLDQRCRFRSRTRRSKSAVTARLP